LFNFQGATLFFLPPGLAPRDSLVIIPHPPSLVNTFFRVF
jgi:hypothetical protein